MGTTDFSYVYCTVHRYRKQQVAAIAAHHAMMGTHHAMRMGTHHAMRSAEESG